MKKLYSVIAVCISIIILFSSTAARAIPVSGQIVWGWDKDSDRICVVDKTQSAFEGEFIRTAFEAVTESSPVENGLIIGCQDCSGLFLLPVKSVSENATIAIDMNTVVADSVLRYVIGNSSANLTIRGDLF
jgi:hypothetical protein